ncbi:MAG: dynamin family protein [Bacteroidaceae bacterium]|nr:dynamin family protein [Bacteroidaceae bacterium]
MCENFDLLFEIAQFLGLDNYEEQLNAIKSRSEREDTTLLLPFVGEFSSGKTTLINALTDSKKLETATKPTTATIYEIHFGCDSCYAKVLTEDMELREIKDIADLKNEELADAKVVTVFDTSKKIPSSTIIVDTPGLSSPDPKHKQTLVNFLPLADGIILIVDINQQITRSLTDFINTMKLSKRPIFLVLTKSDTKSQFEIEAAKEYVSKNCEIPLKQVSVVSAAKGYLDELYKLFESIQKDKKNIIQQVDAQRTQNIVNSLIDHIDELMKASSSDKDLDDAIRKCQYELDKISRNIDNLLNSIGDDIEDQTHITCRLFEDNISSKLNALIGNKSNNFDADAISAINTTASLLMGDFRSNIQKTLFSHANKKKGTDDEIPLESLKNMDLSGVQLSGLSYGLDLNSMGHEYDGMIKTGLIAVTAVAATAAVVATAGGAAAVAGAATIDNVIDVADTVSDVGSIISNKNTANRIETATRFVEKATEEYGRMSQQTQDKGMIDSLIGLATENLMSKPKRARAVRVYIDETLTPEFKSQLNSISERLKCDVSASLHNEASQMITQKADALKELQAEYKEKKDKFNERMDKLREYKSKLLTL